MADCCIKGFEWDGTPAGRIETLGGHDVYVAGDDIDVAMLVIHDVFGWTFTNTRLLADHYAREVGATVYVPDFFDGEVLSPDILRDESRHKEIDLPAFWERNSKPNRTQEIVAFTELLRAKHKKVGAIGFCFGGWAVFRLGSKALSPPLVDCISTAHPSKLEDEEMASIGVPCQIMAAEHDHMFPMDRREVALSILPKARVPFEWQYFPGARHGFATRGDGGDEEGRKALVRAKQCAVAWFRYWLHEVQ